MKVWAYVTVLACGHVQVIETPTRETGPVPNMHTICDVCGLTRRVVTVDEPSRIRPGDHNAIKGRFERAMETWLNLQTYLE